MLKTKYVQETVQFSLIHERKRQIGNAYFYEKTVKKGQKHFKKAQKSSINQSILDLFCPCANGNQAFL
jgi:hypothetical protein